MAQQPDIKKSAVTAAGAGGEPTGRIELETVGGTPATKEEEIRATARNISQQILSLTRNGLFVSLRFLDVALCQFTYVSADMTDLPFTIKKLATTGEHLVYDPKYIIEQYMRDKKALSRDYLHIVLHCIFRHPFVSSKLNSACWNLACDIAVEATICELDLRQANVLNAAEIEAEVERIRGMVRQMTAEHLYRLLMSGEVSAKDIEKWKRLFTRDEHDVWWEVARRIEEEKRRRAEEEARQEQTEGQYDEEQEDDTVDPEEDTEDAEETGDDTEDDEEAAADDADADEEGDAGEDDAVGEAGDDTDEEQELGDPGEEGDEDADDAGEEDGEASEEDSEQDEEEPEEQYDEYTFEDEYTSQDGGDDPRDDSMGDPESDHSDSGEESSGEGSGGGNPGDEPQQSDEEGAERDNDTDGSGIEGQDDGHKPENKDQSGSLSGQTSEGAIDDSEYQDPFGEQNQQGKSEQTQSGGKSQHGDSQSGEHNAGTGGGGSDTQAAWEHSGDGKSSPGGDRDMDDRRQLDGGISPQDKVEQLDGEIENKREAKAERGTNEQEEVDKAPAFMHNGEEQQELEERWKEISERVLVDLETSSKEWGDKSDAMVQGLKKINRDKYDYRTFLQKFSTLKEDIQLNDDEFDYVYYTFGLDHYGNIPLVEPLEYKEVRKVRDFVIAIDTSGSCAGEVVQKFLDKTYSIFSQQENFFRKINLHIIQCDATIQSDVKITNKEEFSDYMKNLDFKGFGGTDFRPVFTYVNEMIEHDEFEDLKGLIYFTDGNGTYPKKRPPYETAFIFVDDDEFDYKVPSWAMKLVLETSDITEEVLV